MNFLTILRSRSQGFYVFAIILGMINSFIYSGILAIINGTISQQAIPFVPEAYKLHIFFSLIFMAVISNRVFRTYMVNLTNEILYQFERNVLQQIRKALLQDYERMGQERVYTAIADTRMLGQIPGVFIELINQTVIIIVSLAYLFYISTSGAIAIVVMMVTLMTFYLVRNKDIEKLLEKARDLRDEYYRYLKDLLLGFKEVKLSQVRNDNLFEQYLSRNMQDQRSLQVKTAIKYTDNELIGTFSWYLSIGLIIFVIPSIFALDAGSITAFVVTVLFLMRPVALLVTVIPVISNVRIALNRLSGFSLELKQESVDASPSEEEETSDTYTKTFKEMRFEKVGFTYKDAEGNPSFELGPINLQIEEGEVIFVTGGNGSGKSTFMNLLTGLYEPTAGEIWLNDKIMKAGDNQSLAAIFTSNHLFSENYNQFDLSPKNELLQSSIELMKMGKVLSYDSSETLFSNNLSKGQQKRLALIYAIMEERPLLVLDEWAAEQDPEFRRYFYTRVIPHLAEMGKTIIAVTHDDRYFDCADRVLKLEFGQIISDKKERSSLALGIAES